MSTWMAVALLRICLPDDNAKQLVLPRSCKRDYYTQLMSCGLMYMTENGPHRTELGDTLVRHADEFQTGKPLARSINRLKRIAKKEGVTL